MNTNGKNQGMNVDDYENMAVQKSNTAKRVAAGAALLVGGAAVAGGAAYATADHGDQPNPDEALTSEDIIDGANAGQGGEVENSQSQQVTEKVVYVEKNVEPEPKPEPEQGPTVTWDDKTVVYDEEGNVIASSESGTVEGKNFTLMDLDGDDHADILAVDLDGNGQYDDNEITRLDVSDHVHMGHETAHTKVIYNSSSMFDEPAEDPHYVAQNDQEQTIHNNFEDEKTGESYHDDYAENNPDYNPNADMNDYGDNNYLAENEAYDASDESFSAEANTEYLAENDGYDKEPEGNYLAEAQDENEPLESTADYTEEYTADAGDSYDAMMGAEEFAG
jgi:hypothetical protein